MCKDPIQALVIAPAGGYLTIAEGDREGLSSRRNSAGSEKDARGNNAYPEAVFFGKYSTEYHSCLKNSQIILNRACCPKKTAFVRFLCFSKEEPSSLAFKKQRKRTHAVFEQHALFRIIGNFSCTRGIIPDKMRYH